MNTTTRNTFLISRIGVTGRSLRSIFILGILLRSAWLPAAPASGETEDAEGFVNVSFRAIGWEISIDDVLYDGISQPMRILPNDFRERYTYSGPPVLEFYREIKSSDPSVGMVEEVVGSVDLTGMSGPLILVFQATGSRGEKERFKIDAFVDQLDLAESGSILMVNLIDRPIAVDFLGQQVGMRSSESAVVRSNELDSNASMMIRVARLEGDGWMPALQTYVGVYPDYGMLFLFGEPTDERAARNFIINRVLID